MNCTDCPYWYEWVGKEFPGCHYPSNDGFAPCECIKESYNDMEEYE